MIIPSDCQLIIKDESYTVQILATKNSLEKLGLGDLSSNEIFFLIESQRAHDGERVDQMSPEQMKRNFWNLAGVYGIPLPIELQEETKP